MFQQGYRAAPRAIEMQYGCKNPVAMTYAIGRNDEAPPGRPALAGFRIDSGVSAQDNLTVQGDFYDSHEQEQTGGTGDASGENLLGRWARNVTRLSDPIQRSLCAKLACRF
jgi:hypothetical protein